MNTTSLPVYKFTYAYVTTGDLAEETIEVEATSEALAHTIARRKVDIVSSRIGLRLVSVFPTKMRRGA